MTRIPKKLRESMALDPFYTRCCITGQLGSCTDRIEWHHNLIFAGKQVQERFAILPVLSSIHRKATDPTVKELLDWVMFNRMSAEDLTLYSKGINYGARLTYLNQKFGPWTLPKETKYI